MRSDQTPEGVSGRETIKIRIRTVSQLFNSLDPSPFIEKDLDAEAEAFIEGWAAETPRGTPLRLILYVESPPEDEASRAGVGDAIRNFFRYKEDRTRRELRRLMGVGRASLLIGLLFVAVCIGAAQAIGQLWKGTAREIVEQSLVIVGWVAMWRPLEIFLYDWWPIAGRAALHRRLGAMKVEFAVGGDGLTE